MAISVMQALSPLAAVDSFHARYSQVSSSTTTRVGVPPTQQGKAWPLGARPCSKVVHVSLSPRLELWQERESCLGLRLPGALGCCGAGQSTQSPSSQEGAPCFPLYDPQARTRSGGGGEPSGREGREGRRLKGFSLSSQSLWQQAHARGGSAVVARPRAARHPGWQAFRGDMEGSRGLAPKGRRPGVCSAAASGDLPQLPSGSVKAEERAAGAGFSKDGAAGGEGLGDGEEELQGIQVQLDLPRRRLLFSFTCGRCQGRSSRLVNPEVLRRGTTFVQCATCEVWHQIVDNLKLIREYDLRLGVENDLSQVLLPAEEDEGDNKSTPM